MMAHQNSGDGVDLAAEAFFHNTEGKRIDTDALMYSKLQALHPDKNITAVPERSIDILAYAASGGATVVVDPRENGTPFGPFAWDVYVPPQSRSAGGQGNLGKLIKFGKFLVHWKDHVFILYLVEGRDGSASYPEVRMNYILGPTPEATEDLLLAVGSYTSALHEEIWVFNSGYWQKDAVLWRSVQQASWDAVILDPDMKDAMIKDVNRFYDSQAVYKRLGIAWKRGVIFHGPPGNGKTISIKATMQMLYARKEPVPSLYVKTLNS
jgi:transitional endoplasmic reticulum ATPase